MSDKRDMFKRSRWKELIDMIFNFIGKSISHLDDISIS